MSAAFTTWDKETLNRLSSQVSELEARLLSVQVLSSAQVKSYTSLAAMKAEQYPTLVRLFILLGLNSSGDGLLNGNYYYDPVSSVTPNDSSIIQLTSISSGRLIKIS